VSLVSSLSMRSTSVLESLIAMLSCRALAQSMAERDAFVEDKTFAAPAALVFGHGFQIFQNAALQLIDLGKAARQQIACRLFEGDPAGAEHRDLPMLGRI